MDSPLVSDAGSVTLGVPMEYAEPDSVNEEIVVGDEAVKVAFCVTGCETVSAGKLRSAPLNAGDDDGRAPKPSNVESFVPTYTTPLSTPGSENTVDVKGWELQTSSSELLTGTGLNASNWEFAPLGPVAWMIQTSADPEVVPFEVTMGVPEP
jgi:hypothetical protein